MIAEQQTWERAEVARSASEATHTPDARLIGDEANLARYLDPPAHTVYPLEYAYSLLGNVRGLTVLDFGCGSGENTLLLARRGARAVGVDISTDLITLARRRLALNGLPGGAQFIVGSAHDLPVETESVDVVFGIAILHHLDLAATSREVHRVLKPGGRAIFQEPVRDSRLIRVLRRCVPYRQPDVSPFERPLTEREVSGFAARFSACSVRAFSLPFVNITQALPPLRRYIHAAYRLDGALLKRAPALKPFTGVRVLHLTK
jgi:SAM-dependent methyltransferase